MVNADQNSCLQATSPLRHRPAFLLYIAININLTGATPRNARPRIPLDKIGKRDGLKGTVIHHQLEWPAVSVSRATEHSGHSVLSEPEPSSGSEPGERHRDRQPASVPVDARAQSNPKAGRVTYAMETVDLDWSYRKEVVCSIYWEVSPAPRPNPNSKP
jgi:hypothetical protein